ncbi:MAG: hypothetical protein QMC36_00445 [Patescibacteria group bacterium]
MLAASALALPCVSTAQTLTNAESKVLLNEVRAKEESDRKKFGNVEIGNYRMNGVKLPPSFAKMPPNPRKTCYFLGKVVEIENGKVVFDDVLESIVREVRCPSSVSLNGS